MNFDEQCLVERLSTANGGKDYRQARADVTETVRAGETVGDDQIATMCGRCAAGMLVSPGPGGWFAVRVKDAAPEDACRPARRPGTWVGSIDPRIIEVAQPEQVS
ncbi:MAG TPA: hypothetical protein VG604_03385 [Candidatus Saccharimonadales bacterium]|nr:hypothetical protein [Candidatus Saccharimonadales bacterium]